MCRKFDRVFDLISKWEQVGKRIRSDCSNGLLGKETHDAAVVALLIYSTGMRPGRDGNETAGEPTYGASTVTGDHVIFSGNNVRLRFIGKKGVQQDVLIPDPWLTNWFKSKSAGPDEQVFDVRTSVLSGYFKSLGGWNPKEFRTAVGTMLAKRLIAESPLPDERRERKKAIRSIAEHVAKILGNTPAVAKRSYIPPELW